MKVIQGRVSQKDRTLAKNAHEIRLEYDDGKEIIIRHLSGAGLSVITRDGGLTNPPHPIRRTMIEPFGAGSFKIYQHLPE